MKRLIVLCSISLLAVACGTDGENTERLTPLPTTGISELDRGGKNTVVLDKLPTTTSPMDGLGSYLSFIYNNGDVPVSSTEGDLLSMSATWCDFMERGMGKSNVVSWITEMASDQAEADLWLASAEASAYYICPEQAYKWNP